MTAPDWTSSVVITVHARTVQGLWAIAEAVAAAYAPGLEVCALRMVTVVREGVRGLLVAEFRFEVSS